MIQKLNYIISDFQLVVLYNNCSEVLYFSNTILFQLKINTLKIIYCYHLTNYIIIVFILRLNTISNIFRHLNYEGINSVRGVWDMLPWNNEKLEQL